MLYHQYVAHSLPKGLVAPQVPSKRVVVHRSQQVLAQPDRRHQLGVRALVFQGALPDEQAVLQGQLLAKMPVEPRGWAA